MKTRKLAHGWQYAVYDCGDKVTKVPLSREDMREILLRRDVQYEEGELVALIDRLIMDRKESIAGVQGRGIDRSLVGNPIFKEGGIYLQDKSVTLRDKLNSLAGDIDGRHRVIDEYVRFISECWRRGFSERTYNLTKNNAYNHSGVVLIDFGEITFSKEEVVSDIEDLRWLKSWSFMNDLDPEGREYYRKQMKLYLTLENLDRYWGDAPMSARNLNYNSPYSKTINLSTGMHFLFPLNAQ